MDKVKRHFKTNLPIYLVVFTCIVVLGISFYVTKQNKKEEVATVDTSMFKVLTLEETLKRFDEAEPTVLVIGYKTCSATIHYTPYLQIAQAKYGYDTYYLELDSIDESQKEKYDELVEKLDMEYNFQGSVEKFGNFIGSTPMTIIIKNHKMVYGYIGSINDDTLGSLAKMYGIATRDYQK